MKNKKRDKVDILFKQTYRNFLLKILLVAVLMPIILVILIFIVDKLDFQWVYDISPNLYYRGRDFFYNGPFSSTTILILIIIWVIITLIMLYRMLKKVFSYINAVSDASNQLLDKNVSMIELPDELEDIQSKMNILKMTSEKNERLAEENEKRKNDLIVYLAHDLKTPLTSLIGYFSLIDEVKDMPQNQREKYVKIALEKSYKLEDLINELFDIARFNSETIVLEKEEMNLNMMIEQIIDDFYPTLKDLDKEIKYKSDDKIIIDGDPDKLYRVFNNLLKNAINYSTDKTIKIETSRQDDKVNIIVSNKAKKIPEEKLARLFEKFYRADSSRTSKTGGSGLGLAIAKEIVELHDGTIKATSDDKYIKFYIELPIKSLK
ncbi:MAG: HAMP domain-containing sensor histidine kinase [Bacilli bacterium]|nr:HAMP domain-containing sensor histidine kinase [Bacilli bacterium]MDY5058866.1 HAMP domain-containing sensor histidine kinase [Bacilli bacterium]